MPFATTTMAKGMIDEDHPLSVGVIERSCRQIQRKLLRSADLIVGLGYDTVEVEYEAWIGEMYRCCRSISKRPTSRRR